MHLLENKQYESSMKNEIELGLRKCSRADIAVAYVTNKGLSQILPSLRSAINRKCKARILIGLSSDGFNEPDALKTILNLYRSRKLRFGISTLKDEFHQKTYIFHRLQKPLFAVLGSSNLTGKGLVGPGELNVVLDPEDAHDTRVFTQLDRSYERNWSNSCRSLRKLTQVVESYRKHRQRTSGRAPLSKKSWNRIAKLIGKPAEEDEDSETKSKRRGVKPVQAWYMPITRTLSKRTDDAIEAQFGWSDQGFTWVSITKGEYDRLVSVASDKGVVLFIHNKVDNPGWLLRRYAEDIDVLPRAANKSDGKYFLAYQGKGRRRKFSKEFKNDLLQADFVKKMGDLGYTREIADKRHLDVFLNLFK